jgi:hypothetical protein
MQPNPRALFRWPPTYWIWFAVVCWTLVFVGLVIRLLVANGLHSVYPILADAARCWQRGEDMYWPHHHVPGLDVYRYSPAVAQIISSFAIMPNRVGSVLWLGVNTVLFVAGLTWWLRTALPRAMSLSQMAGASLLVLTFAAGNLHNGQSNTVVTAMLLIAATAVCTERWTLASGCIAVATLFKVYPLAFGLLLILAFPKQLLPRLTLALLLGVALPFLVRPPDYVLRQYQNWYDVVRLDNRKHAELPRCYRDLWLLIRVSGATFPPGAYAALQGVGAIATAGICLWGKYAGLNARALTMVSLNLAALWMMLLGPATESSTYLLLAPTLAWIVFDTWNVPTVPFERALLVAGLLCFGAAHVSVWFPDNVRHGAIFFQPVGTLLLAVVTLRRTWNEILARCRASNPTEQDQRLLAA